MPEPVAPAHSLVAEAEDAAAAPLGQLGQREGDAELVAEGEDRRPGPCA